jgi:antibiotic biosynthesis monooxygenase (ABM) superfamily enzyme
MMQGEMGALQVGSAFLVGAAGLALWLDVRLGSKRTPRSLARVVIHAALAWLAVHLVAVFGTPLIDPSARIQTVLVLSLLVLPGWMYAFLVSIWTMKLVRSALPR